MKYNIKNNIFHIVIFFVIIFSITAFQQRNLLDNKIPAPYFNLQTLLSKERYSIKQLRGQKTVIYFFAPWCNVCKLSMPNLNKLHNNGQLNAVAIAVDYQSMQAVNDFVDELNINMPVLLADTYTMSDYKVSAFPTYYVISEDLTIIGKSMGYSTELGLRARTF